MLVPGPGRDVLDGGYDPRQARQGQLPDTIDYRDSLRPVVLRLPESGRWTEVRVEGIDRLLGEAQLRIVGSRGDDRIIGSSGDDELFGNGGVDRLAGKAGDDAVYDGDNRPIGDDEGSRDRLRGGAGSDWVASWIGPDDVDGGSGDDRLTVTEQCSRVLGRGGADVLALSDGAVLERKSTITFDARAGQVQAAGDAPCGWYRGAETYELFFIDTLLTFLGTDGPDVIRAQFGAGLTAHTYGGDDMITGTGYDDVVFAGDGVDRVDARSGFDVCVDAEATVSCEAPSTDAVETEDWLPSGPCWPRV